MYLIISYAVCNFLYKPSIILNCTFQEIFLSSNENYKLYLKKSVDLT